jgi:hypothetical protein
MPPLHTILLITGLAQEVLLYLQLNSLCRLETALTNPHVQSDFTSMLTAIDPVLLPSDTLPYSRAAMLWITRNKMRLRHCTVVNPGADAFTRVLTVTHLIVEGITIKYTNATNLIAEYLKVPRSMLQVVTGLSFQNCWSPFQMVTCAVFPNLKRLYLDSISDVDEGDIIRMLRNCPLLKDVALLGLFTPEADYAEQIKETLDRLEKLHLECTLPSNLITGVLERCRCVKTVTFTTTADRDGLDLSMYEGQQTFAACLSTIEGLTLNNIVVRGSSLAILAHACPRLRTLEAPLACVRSAVLQAWSVVGPPLQTLQVQWSADAPGMVHKCASVWAGLRSVELSNVTIHSAQAVATALSYMRCLETFCLSKGTVTEGLVLGLASSCPTLRVLRITDCFADNSAEAWQAFAAGHPSLREFSFSSSVTDDMMVALSTHCPQITRLELQSAQLLTDVSVVALSKGCPQLSEVALRQATALTDASLQALRAHCKQLQRLQLPGRDALAHKYIVV